jgi:predicted nuclease of predicted toxin-antitoxin system
MKLLADTNVPQPITARLRAEGHEISYIQRTAPDHILLEDAYRQDILIITLDKDFQRLVLDEKRPTAGVLHLRIRPSIPVADWANIIVNLLSHREQELRGAYTILTESIVEIRRPIL